MTAMLSPGVHLHFHINVRCVRFAFAIVNACADGQTQVLASILHITLFLCLFLMVQGWVGAAAVQVFEGTPFQFNVRS